MCAPGSSDLRYSPFAQSNFHLSHKIVCTDREVCVTRLLLLLLLSELETVKCVSCEQRSNIVSKQMDVWPRQILYLGHCVLFVQVAEHFIHSRWIRSIFITNYMRGRSVTGTQTGHTLTSILCFMWYVVHTVFICDPL